MVVGFGLMIRSYLSRLNLLLVPRISAVLIVVIVLYMLLSIVGYRMGLEGTLNVTYFPMIIIAWTIERMSVLWEEEGPREGMVQGGGSLLVAILAYLVMTDGRRSGDCGAPAARRGALPVRRRWFAGCP